MAPSREVDVRPSPRSRPRVRAAGNRNVRLGEPRRQADPYDWERDGEAFSDEPQAQEPSPAGVQPQEPGVGRPARLPVWFGPLCIAVGWLVVGFVASASAVLVLTGAILVLRGVHH